MIPHAAPSYRRTLSTARAAFMAMPIIIAAGCATRGRLAEHITMERTRAAENWPNESGADDLPSLTNLTLNTAVEIALRRNRTLLAARQELEVARGKLRESYSAASPNISAHAGYTRLDDVSRIEMGPSSISIGFEDNYSADITLRQPIFHGGAIPAALRIGQLWMLFYEETVRTITDNVIFETASAYYDAILATEMIAVHEQAAAFAEALLADTRRKKDAGIASEYEVLRAEVEVSNSRAELLRAKNAASIATIRLAKTLGIRDYTLLMPTDDLTSLQESVPDPEKAIRSALANRPELRRAETELMLQQQAVLAARSSRSPALDAFFTRKWSNPDPHNSTRDAWGNAWTAGLAVALPLFDTALDGKIAQEEARLNQVRIRLSEQEEIVALDVRQALANLENSAELVASQKLNLKRAEEGLRLALAGFANNTKTSVEVMDAHTALTRTRALYFQSLHANMTAVLNLKRALGVLGMEWIAGEGEGQGHLLAE